VKRLGFFLCAAGPMWIIAPGLASTNSDAAPALIVIAALWTLAAGIVAIFIVR
jgi:hypothetical protein